MAINFNELSPEQIQKGIACKTLDEFKDFAEREGFQLSEAEAQDIFEQLYANGLSDEEIEAVAGGTEWHDSECTEHQCAFYGVNRLRKRRRNRQS